MMKRVIYICAWTLLFLIATSILTGFAGVLYLAVTGNYPRNGEHRQLFPGSWFYIQGVIGWTGALTGFLLGVFGKLPGTRKQRNVPPPLPAQ